jgi:hypothetical protein
LQRPALALLPKAMETIPSCSCHAVFFEKLILISTGSWFPSLLFSQVQSLVLNKNQIAIRSGKAIQIKNLESCWQGKTNFSGHIC